MQYALPINNTWSLNASINRINGHHNDTRGLLGFTWNPSSTQHFERPLSSHYAQANLIVSSNIKDSKNTLLGINSFGKVETKVQAKSLVSSQLMSSAPIDAVAPSQTNSTNLGSFTLGNTLTQTLTFDEAISTVVVSGLPAGITETHSISGNQVTITLSVNPLIYTFSSATDTIPFTLTVGDGAPASNTRTLSESAQISDVAPSFAAQTDATRDDDGAGNPIIPVTGICPTGTDSFGRTIISCVVTVVNPPHNDMGLSYNAASNYIEGTIDVSIDSTATVERVIRVQGGAISQITNSIITIVNNL